jgi:uncharacterized protein (DUF427 family)
VTPPRVDAVTNHIAVTFGGSRIAESTRVQRVLEPPHPPVYYIPLADVSAGALVAAADARQTFCEWKGLASYYDVVGADGSVVPRAAWTYLEPTPAFEAIRGAVAFYPRLMDECTVDGERVAAQDGDYYGGWITGDAVRP